MPLQEHRRWSANRGPWRVKDQEWKRTISSEPERRYSTQSSGLSAGYPRCAGPWEVTFCWPRNAGSEPCRTGLRYAQQIAKDSRLYEQMQVLVGLWIARAPA